MKLVIILAAAVAILLAGAAGYLRYRNPLATEMQPVRGSRFI